MMSSLACGLSRFRWIAVTSLLLLAACGGGGGGGGGGGSGGGSTLGFDLSRSSMAFSAENPASATPATQSFTATARGGTVYIAIYYAGAAISYVNTSTSGPTVTIEVVPLPPSVVGTGTHTGTVTIRGFSDPAGLMPIPGALKTLNVTYTVGSSPVLSVTPAYLHHAVAVGQSPAAQTLSLTSSAGSAAWTSSVTYDSGASGWLTVPPAGATPDSISVSVNSAPLGDGVNRAHITFSSNGVTRTVPVSLVVNTAGVKFVSPYVGTTSSAGSVIIRGFGFAGATQVKFGATDAAAFTVVSDTEIRADYPALAQGSYPVTVGALATRANLVITDAPAFAYATIARPAGATAPRTVIYDAERRMLYLSQDPFTAVDRLERYRFAAASWTVDPPLTGFGSANLNTTIALSPDGTEILKTNYNAMGHISTSSFTISANVSATATLGAGASYLNLMAMTNDAGAIGNANSTQYGGGVLYRYDVLNREFQLLDTPSGMSELINRLIRSSGDGSRALLGSFASASAAVAVYQYNASDADIVATPATTKSAQNVALDRYATKAIIETAPGQHTVFDSSYNALGILPALSAYVISPDGTKVYTYVAGSPGAVHVYDLNSPVGGSFAEIGTGTSVPDAPGNGVNMQISPDGGSLFVVGAQRVIVMPAP